MSRRAMLTDVLAGAAVATVGVTAGLWPQKPSKRPQQASSNRRVLNWTN
jgi:hypothetical protein